MKIDANVAVNCIDELNELLKWAQPITEINPEGLDMEAVDEDSLFQFDSALINLKKKVEDLRESRERFRDWYG